MLFQQSVNKIKIIKMCIYLIVLALIFKVGYIQIIDRKNIYDKALESWQRSFPVQANRGKIYDRSENVLAVVRWRYRWKEDIERKLRFAENCAGTGGRTSGY